MFLTRLLRLYLRIFLLLFLFADSISGSAQNCTPLYHNSYAGTGNDEPLFILATSDRGSVIAGRTTSAAAGNYDAFLTKLTEAGSVQWSYNYGGSSFDELTKVRTTADGGYIALGLTQSFGNTNGEPFLVKTSSTGNPLWSLRISSSTSVRERPKDITVLRDGSYVVLINRADSTAQGDGLICRLSPSGTIIWSQAFDHGDDDGLNTVVEEGDSLVVGGFATGDKRDALLMKMSVATGNVYWAKKYVHRAGHDEEILNVELIPGGLAFASQASMRNSNFSSYRLGLFKWLNNGQFTYKLQANINANTLSVESVVSRLTPNQGFAYMMNESGPKSYSELVRVNEAGFPSLSTSLYEMNGTQLERMTGLDTSVNRGYWVAGYRKVWPDPKTKMHVYKLDQTGYAGSCVPFGNTDFIDTVNYTISEFNWSNRINAGIAVNPITISWQANNITLGTSCDTTSCTVTNTPTSACNSGFLSFLQGPGRVDLHDVEATGDGGTISVGNIGTQPFITKIAADGVITWTRTYTEFRYSMFFKRIIPTKDGNYLIIGIDGYEINHGASTNTKLIKVDGNGNILWAKRVVTGGMLNAYDAVCTEDGGYILTLNYGFGLGYTYSYLMRLSAAGDIVWKRQIHHLAGSPVYKNLFLKNDDLYLLADNYLPQYYFRVERWNAATGQMVWNNRFWQKDATIKAGNIACIGDTVYVLLHSIGAASWNNTNINIVVCKLDTTGKLLSNYRFTTPNYSENSYSIFNSQHQPFAFLQATDGNFVVAQQTRQDGMKALNITKFAPAGNLIWSRSYPNLNTHYVWSLKNVGDHLLIGGRMEIQSLYDINKPSSFVLKTDAYGRIKEGATGLCQSDSVGVVKGVATGIEPIWNDLDSVTNERTIQITPISLENTPFFIEAELKCAYQSTCTDVKLSGPETICDQTKTYTYHVIRNSGCTAPATWTYDTSYVRIISSTDSTLSLQFRKPGHTVIGSRLSTGCAVLSATKSVNVFRSAVTLTLGADTVICPGNTLLLKAGPGYTRYQWQDRSSDSTHAVTEPGSYYVKVTDACGETFEDSITVSPHPPIPFDAGLDRTKCNNDTLHLQAPSGFNNYTWSPSYNISSTTAQSVVVNPLVDTAYYVRAEKMPGCFAYDTIRVAANHSPQIQLGPDQSFCSGESLQLDAGAGFSTYRWSTGETSQNIIVKTKGQFSVIGTADNGCTSYDTLAVTNTWPLPQVSLNKNSELCAGTTRTLNAGSFASYKWHDGSKAPSFTLSDIGEYYVQVTDNHNCVGGDSVVITTILPSPGNFLPVDTALCSYSKLTLKPQRNYTAYQWSTGSRSPDITIEQPGQYWLQVTDSKGCTGKNSIVINPKDCMNGVYIPSAFTPGNDGKNDQFRVKAFGLVKKFELTVFNRWGEVAFSTTNPDKGWDGKFAGKELPNGVFVWICRYQLEGGKEQIDRGTVTLVR